MDVIISLLDRDLGKLHTEIELFSREANLWENRGDISNSAGNLCLHLVGNLNHFIGAVIGNSGYVRDREAEFSSRNVPKIRLLVMIEETRQVTGQALKKMPAERLAETYPVEVFGHPMTCAYFLIHLISHLNYHLGQINYLRRIIDKT